MKAVKRDAREMKDSGIEWIGEMPQLWSTARLKDICSIQTGTTPDKKRQDEYYTNEGGIPWIKAENLGDSTPISITKEYLTDKGANAGRVFANNTVYVCCIASIGKVGYSEITCSCNQQINGLIFDSKYIDYKYGFYMSLAQEEEYMLRASGNVLKILNTQQQSYIPCVVPSLREQQAIADYLDDRCAKIDAIIAEAKASIEEYKELKQSMIAGKVKMGVRPASTVKNSGVNYLGDIPSHWQVRRISTLYEESKEDGRSDLPILMVSINSGISDTEVSDENRIRKVIRSEDKTIYKVVHPNYLAYNMMRAWQGAFGAAQVDGLVSPAYVVVRPKDESVDSRYVEALLRTPKMMEVIRGRSYGIADFRLRLYWPYFKDIKICLPPIREQKEIVEYLKNGLGKIDELISEKQSLIEDLESYKKSLIYEVVTGKRKVVD